MAVLVIWYGDLPREEAWFVERRPLALDRAGGGRFHPGFAGADPRADAVARTQQPRSALRAVGACVLVGLAVYDAYLIVPPCGDAALLTALLALIGIGLALLRLSSTARHASPHAEARPCPLRRTSGKGPSRRRSTRAPSRGRHFGALALHVRRHRRAEGDLRRGRAGQSACRRHRTFPPPRVDTSDAAQLHRLWPSSGATRTWRWANANTRWCRFRSSAPCRSWRRRAPMPMAPLCGAATLRPCPRRQRRRAGCRSPGRRQDRRAMRLDCGVPVGAPPPGSEP